MGRAEQELTLLVLRTLSYLWLEIEHAKWRDHYSRNHFQSHYPLSDSREYHKIIIASHSQSKRYTIASPLLTKPYPYRSLPSLLFSVFFAYFLILSLSTPAPSNTLAYNNNNNLVILSPLLQSIQFVIVPVHMSGFYCKGTKTTPNFLPKQTPNELCAVNTNTIVTVSHS